MAFTVTGEHTHMPNPGSFLHANRIGVWGPLYDDYHKDYNKKPTQKSISNYSSPSYISQRRRSGSAKLGEFAGTPVGGLDRGTGFTKP